MLLVYFTAVCSSGSQWEAASANSATQLPTVWFNVSSVANFSQSYETQALVYALAGLANSQPDRGDGRHNSSIASESRRSNRGDPHGKSRQGKSNARGENNTANSGTHALLLDTNTFDLDYPESDRAWKAHLEETEVAAFTVLSEQSLCALVNFFQNEGAFSGLTLFNPDGFSVYPALTLSGIARSLPATPAMVAAHPCLQNLTVTHDLRQYAWRTKLEATRWAIDRLLPLCSRSLAFNADHYPNAVPTQAALTLMSVDVAVANRAFVMDLSVLWVCDPVNCGDPPHRNATPEETALYVEVISSLEDGVAVMGWGDPEHAFTNVTSAAGGVVLCSFSAPNLAFWQRLGEFTGQPPLKLPNQDSGHRLGPASTTYLIFETNEGDTPRILSSQFTSAWLSSNRGSIPISWAVDPLLASMFPALWNYYAATALANDTFVTGVDGAGYVFINSLGPHTDAYEQRAGAVIASEIGSAVVDVGVADARWPAVTVAELERYVRNAKVGGKGPAAILNACGSDYGQPVNFWLSDGTPVFNSLCHGPPTDPDRHYLYYYRSFLNVSDPVGDLAGRIRWAATHRRPSENQPMFLVVFGGLGLYGGNDDLFLFLRAVMARLDETFVVVGGEEAARLAREVKIVT